MTEDLVMLKKPSRVGSYRGMECKIPDCELKPRRNNLCNKHSIQYRSGTLLLSGERRLKKVIRYSVDASCKVHRCENKSRIIKGFCKSHYSSYRRGILDYDGFDTGRRKRVASYALSDLRCKVKGCEKVPRDVGFCHNHGTSYRNGHYDKNGKRLTPVIMKNEGKKCSVRSCNYNAYCKGYCRTHYKRYIDCLPIEREFINKGKNCVIERCTAPAARKGYCGKHFYRLMNDRPMRRIFVNKLQKCSACGNPAYCKGMCRKCYSKFSYAAKKSRVELSSVEAHDYISAEDNATPACQGTRAHPRLDACTAEGEVV